MYFNNRNHQTGFSMGCSIFGCLAMLLLASLIVRGSLYFFFRYFWLILVLGAIVWVFRRFVHTDDNSHEQDESPKRPNWNRDFENRSDSGYHNIERDFEEIDEEDDDFNDF